MSLPYLVTYYMSLMPCFFSLRFHSPSQSFLLRFHSRPDGFRCSFLTVPALPRHSAAVLSLRLPFLLNFSTVPTILAAHYHCSFVAVPARLGIPLKPYNCAYLFLLNFDIVATILVADYGTTPVYIALAFGHVEVMKLLCDAGAAGPCRKHGGHALHQNTATLKW